MTGRLAIPILLLGLGGCGGGDGGAPCELVAVELLTSNVRCAGDAPWTAADFRVTTDPPGAAFTLQGLPGMDASGAWVVTVRCAGATLPAPHRLHVIDLQGPGEALWCLLNLLAVDCADLLAVAEEASDWAEANQAALGGGLHTGGPADAGRHQYWACLTAVLFGDDVAESLTTAHEVTNLDAGGACHDTRMDLTNNAEGIRLALSISSDGDQARADCADAVLANLAAGTYAVIEDGDKYVFPADP